MIRTLLVALLLASSALVPAVAFAATTLPKMLVMDIPADPQLKANTVKALNDFLEGALRDQHFQVFTASDIGAALGLEKQKQLLGCSESNCIAEIGGALGAEYIVRGTVAMLGKSAAVTLILLDDRGQVSNQVRQIVQSSDPSDLFAAIEEMVPKLVAKVRPTSSASVDSKPAAPEPAAGGLVSSQEAGGGTRGARVASYALMGVGGAALASSLVFGILAKTNVSKMDDVVAGTGTGDLESLRSSAARDAKISDYTLIGGAVVAGVGLVLFFTSHGSSDAQPEAVSATGRGATPLAFNF